MYLIIINTIYTLQIIPLLASKRYRRHLKRGITVKILLAFIVGTFYETVLIFYDLKG